MNQRVPFTHRYKQHNMEILAYKTGVMRMPLIDCVGYRMCIKAFLL